MRTESLSPAAEWLRDYRRTQGKIPCQPANPAARDQSEQLLQMVETEGYAKPV